MTDSVSAETVVGVAITKAFVRAVWCAAQSLRSRAIEAESCPEFKLTNSVGKILRRQAEEDRQRYAILNDWVERYRGEVGLDEDEVRG